MIFYAIIYNNITWTLDFMDKSLTSSTHEVEAANKRGIWVHYDAWAGGIWGVHWGELFFRVLGRKIWSGDVEMGWFGMFFKSSCFGWDSEQDGGCLNITKQLEIMIPSFDLRYSNVAMENPLFIRFFPMKSPFSSGIFQSATGSFRFWFSLREWSHDSRVPLRKRNREKRASTSWRALRPNLSLAQT